MKALLLLALSACALEIKAEDNKTIIYEVQEFGHVNSIVISNKGWAQNLPWMRSEARSIKIFLPKDDSIKVNEIFENKSYEKLESEYSCVKQNCREDEAIEKMVFVTEFGLKTVYCDNGLINGIPNEYLAIQKEIRKIEMLFRKKIMDGQ